MDSLLPSEPVGNGPLYTFCRRMIRCMKAYRPRGSDSVDITITSEGTVLRARSKGGGGSAGFGQFWVSQVFDDYITGFDNFARTGIAVSIAKQPELWLSITSESFFGSVTSYQKIDTQSRQAFPPNSPAEVHVVNPPWDTTTPAQNGKATSQSIVFAVPVDGGVLGLDGNPKLDGQGNPITLLEVSGREWAFGQ